MSINIRFPIFRSFKDELHENSINESRLGRTDHCGRISLYFKFLESSNLEISNTCHTKLSSLLIIRVNNWIHC